MDPITQGVAGNAIWTALMAVAAVVESEGGDEDEILDEIRQDNAQEEDDVEHDKAA
jgi:hypothetical protein